MSVRPSIHSESNASYSVSAIARQGSFASAQDYSAVESALLQADFSFPGDDGQKQEYMAKLKQHFSDARSASLSLTSSHNAVRVFAEARAHGNPFDRKRGWIEMSAAVELRCIGVANQNIIRSIAVKDALGIEWSMAGERPGKKCTHFNEIADPHTWGDNYLCSNFDLALRWSSAGEIDEAGLSCVQIIETADSAGTWLDNYLCYPESLPFDFQWSSAGPVAGLDCIKVEEHSEPPATTWNDNYLCVAPKA
ncbi:MAG: hypothetical protein AAGL24_28685 [Pseudomonadota bacterium]